MPEQVPFSENEWMPLIAAGDRRAFNWLFNAYYPRLVFFALRYRVEREEAEDIVSEAFARFWAIRMQFDAINKIKSFLYIAARNACLNTIRDRKPTSELQENVPDSDPQSGELESIRAELIGTIFNEINQLPDKCREVVLLTYRDGLSTNQIAEKMNISVSNVTSQRSRAISLLKMAVAEKYPIVLSIALQEELCRLLSGR